MDRLRGATLVDIALPAAVYQSSSSLLTSPSEKSLLSSYSAFDSKHVPARVVRKLYRYGLLVDARGKVVWHQHSHHHPRNWSLSRKCYDTALICFLEFLMTLASNTGSTTADQIYESYGMTKRMALFCFTFAYLAGQAIGGLFLPPVSETFGGRTIYVATTALYALGNLLIGWVPRIPVIVVARFLTGFFSAMPGTVAAGSLENM